MTRIETLTQCQFHHRHPGSDRIGIDVAWIETKLAKKGLVLKFRDLEGTYEVVEVYNTRPKVEVVADEHNFKKQRIVSDVERDPNRGKGHMEF